MSISATRLARISFNQRQSQCFEQQGKTTVRVPVSGVLVMGNDYQLTANSWIESHHLQGETLITYPVPQRRLGIFRYFLEPASIAPVEQRTAELTIIILQLVARTGEWPHYLALSGL